MPTERTPTEASGGASPRGPRDAVLERVLATAGAVFERRVGPGDGFLALGGDSLVAVELSLRLHEELGVEPDFEDILFAADFAALAERLAALAAGSESGAGPSTDTRTDTDTGDRG